MMEEKESLTVEDLARVLICVQKDDSAEYENVSADKASHLQFDTWARSRVDVEGDDGNWPLEERVCFCDMLWKADALALLKKGVELP